MSREVRRVPLDFDWPIGEVWDGYLTPETLHEEQCLRCKGSGYSDFAQLQQARWYGNVPFSPTETGSSYLTEETPQVRAFAERNVAHSPRYYGIGELAIRAEARRLSDLWNGMWSHHLQQEDIDALVADERLMNFTHTWAADGGWKLIEPAPVVTAARVNAWSIEQGIGHDSINCWVVIKAACERAGQPESCPDCNGHGSHERYPGQRAEAEAWEAIEPPTGEGWQLWETTSEGSPKSPVFATGEELAQWMSRNPCGFASARISLETARKWVNGSGWSASMIGIPGVGVVDGITAMDMLETGTK